MDFVQKLSKKWDERKYICVGLDPESDKLPDNIDSFFEFNKKIIDATHDIVAAYKPNSAFYEGLGVDGIDSLKKTVDYINANYPDVVVILDAKRADIGNTNMGYVRFAFDVLKCDAITVGPYLGKTAMEPFLERAEKGVFVLCKTSNPGSDEFQNLAIGDKMLYQIVANHVSEFWNSNNNCGLVVGATYPEELLNVRNIDDKIPLLIPGIGFQGGDLANTVRHAQRNFLISSSRGVIYASTEDNFYDSARTEVEKLNSAIQESLNI